MRARVTWLGRRNAPCPLPPPGMLEARRQAAGIDLKPGKTIKQHCRLALPAAGIGPPLRAPIWRQSKSVGHTVPSPTPELRFPLVKMALSPVGSTKPVNNFVGGPRRALSAAAMSPSPGPSSGGVVVLKPVGRGLGTLRSLMQLRLACGGGQARAGAGLHGTLG